MKTCTLVTAFILSVLLISFGPANSTESTVVSKKVSLISGNEEITYIQLENTHTRSYKDFFSGFQHNLRENDEGVLWKIMCVGIKTDKPFDKVLLQNENQSSFSPVTNIIETSEDSKATDSEGNVIFQGPTTTFFLAGPEHSKEVTIMFGSSAVTFAFSEK